MKMCRVALGALLCAGLIFTASFGTAEDVAIPRPQGPVSDYVGLLSARDIETLNALIEEVKQKTTAEIAVLIVPTTAPLQIEEYSVKVFSAWGVGQKTANNGVLLVVAQDDRALRIEVGYGLEGAMPDAYAKSIVEGDMIPFFKKGDFKSGIFAGVKKIALLIAGEYNVVLEDVPVSAPTPQDPDKILFVIIVVFAILITLFGRAGIFWWFFPFPGVPGNRRGKDSWYRGGSSWGSGGFSGGFGGFGGGMSGGGGASGRW